jgi:hypothetical protein
MNINEQETYTITIQLTTDANPNKWDWAEMLELMPEEAEKFYINVERAN